MKYKILFGRVGISKRPREEDDINYIRKACRVLFFVFATCSFAIAIERFFKVKVLGSYTATFINYHSSLSSVVSKFAGMTDMVFFLYLGTFPDPRKSKMIFGYKMAFCTQYFLQM